MRFEIDAAKLHMIASQHPGTLLGLLARRFAAEGCSITLKGPELAALARNQPQALGCLLCQTTFSAGSESPAWEFNLEGDWKPITKMDPLILSALLGKRSLKPDDAVKVHAYHSAGSSLSVYWVLEPKGLATIFHCPSFAIRNADRDAENGWEFVDPDAEPKIEGNFAELAKRGIVSPSGNVEFETSS